MGNDTRALQLGKIINMTGQIETFLTKNYKATGGGLNEKINSVEQLLKNDKIEIYKLRIIVGLRNKSVHEGDFDIDSIFKKFESSYNDVFKQLTTAQGSKTSKNKEKFNLKETIKKENLNTINFSKMPKYIIIISILIYVYYSFFRTESVDTIQKNISKISIQIETENAKLKNLNKTLKDEQIKQGKFKTFFYDNKEVDALEKRIDTIEDTLENLNTKLNENQEKL